MMGVGKLRQLFSDVSRAVGVNFVTEFFIGVKVWR